MSTLTKILIVLLTLSSIFLCGITVTYVGTANNYKKLYDSRRNDINALERERDGLKTTVNDLNKTINDNKISHDSALDTLREEINDTRAELQQTKNDLDDAQTRLENATAVLSDNSKTIEMNNKLTKEAKDEVARLLNEQSANTLKIQQLTDQVVSQGATIEQLQNDKKRLIEEKTKIQNELDKNLQLAGLISTTPSPVTATTGLVQMSPAVKDIDLEGVIIEVRPQDSLAAISIGSANGVKNNMRFHVIRNNAFVCDIVITKTDADQSSGYLDLITNTMPKAGDKVKTNF